jgi:hypothetical protein
MTDDELENILGPELFSELNTMGDEFVNDPFLDIDENVLEEIASTVYELVIPFQGDLGIELVTALHHMNTTDCGDCYVFLNQFLIALLGHMWTQILASVGNE